MKTVTIGFILLFVLAAFRGGQEVSDAVKFKMFCSACKKGFSTSHDWVVIKVKDLATGETKEICTTPNLISGALYRETGLFTIGVNCDKFANRYFEFSNDSALWNIGFADYSQTVLIGLKKRINLDSLLAEVNSDKTISIQYGDTELRYFAHAMFNRGIVTTTGCFGTTISRFK